MKRVVSRNCTSCNARIHKIKKNVWYVCSICDTHHRTEEEALKCESRSVPYVYPKGTEMVGVTRVNGILVYKLGVTENTPEVDGHTLRNAYVIGQSYVYATQELAAVKLAELFREQNITQLPSNV